MITISIAPPLPSWTGHDRPPREATPAAPASHPCSTTGLHATNRRAALRHPEAPRPPGHTPLTAVREAVNFRSICFDAFRTAP